ncbi:MAG: oligosaccharide flippase family protein, partial [Solirubrobacteraceae bacterium]
SSLLFSVYSNVDYVIVGTELGPTPTGIYWRAFQVGGVYQGKISQIMLSLALPVYSRTRNLDEMRRMRRRVVQVHANVIFPLLATYVVLAPLLVPLVWGAPWAPAIVPSQILSFLGMTFALGTGTAAILVAAGHPRAVLVNNIVQVACYVAVVYAFAPDGLTTLCIAIVVLSATLYVGQYYVIMDRIAGIPIRQLWQEIRPALVSMVPLFACGIATVDALEGVRAPALATIAAGAIASLGAYAGCMRLFHRAAFDDLVLLFGRALRSGA